MFETPEQPAPISHDEASIRRAQPLWFWAILAAMLIAFSLVIVNRDVIRAHWWAHKLAACEDRSEQTYYINALLNVGDAADNAVRHLMSHERADVRAAAVLVLGHDSTPEDVADLARMLADSDRDVRESAARSLAFLERAEATAVLIDALDSQDSDAATAAAAGLSHNASLGALAALCRAASEDQRPVVRAQAVESLAALLTTLGGEALTEEGPQCRPVQILIAALTDNGRFSGMLALESEIAAARGVAATGNASAAGAIPTTPHSSAQRRVGDVARQSVSMLLGEPHKVPSPLSAEAAAELADLLRRRIADRPVRIEMPTTLPTAASPRP